jgi:hypothetical protein
VKNTRQRKDATIDWLTRNGRYLSGVNTRSSILLQAAIDGYGFCHIDTKAGCKDILERLPEHRLDDVVFLGSSDHKVVNGFDLLETNPHTQIEKGPSETVADVLTAEEYSSPTHRQIAKSSTKLATELDTPFIKLSDVFTQNQDTADTDGLGPLAHEVLSMDPADEAIESFEQRWSDFVESPQLRESIGNQNPISLYEAVQSGKIILVGAGGYPQEHRTRFAGALLRKLTEVFQTRDSDSDLFFLSVDEIAQIPLSKYGLDDLFTNPRSWNVGLIPTIQYITQVDTDDKHLLMDNCPNLICFHQNDINAANKFTSALNVDGRDELMQLKRYRVIGNLMAKHGNTEIKFETFPPIEPLRNNVDCGAFEN